MEITKMVDALSRAVTRGDFVLFTTNNYLILGLVVGVSKASIFVNRQGSGSEMIMKSDHFILIPENEVYDMANEEIEGNYDTRHAFEYADALIVAKQNMINDEK